MSQPMIRVRRPNLSEAKNEISVVRGEEYLRQPYATTQYGVAALVKSSQSFEGIHKLSYCWNLNMCMLNVEHGVQSY